MSSLKHTILTVDGKYLRLLHSFAIFALIFVIAFFVFSNKSTAKDGFKICASYDHFLDQSKIVDTNKCDALTKLLIDNRNIDSVRFLPIFTDFYPQGSNFWYLGSAINQLLLGNMEQNGVLGHTFWALDASNKSISYVFAKLEDSARFDIYNFLIDKIRQQLLETELPVDSQIFRTFPTVIFGEGVDGAFEILDQVDADRALLCLFKVDNLSVLAERVVQSKAFSSCIK